jgi:hypothetical protein
MTKRWMILLAALASLHGCAESAFAQAQTSFSAQVLAANPSLYLTFNNPAQLFRENTTGASFLSSPSFVTAASTPSSNTANNATNTVYFPGGAALAGGSLQSVTVNFVTAPTAGQSLTFVIGTISGSSVTINDQFTVVCAATTGTQTFIAGTDFTARNVVAGQTLGFWAASGAAGVPAYGPFNNTQGFYSHAGAIPAIGTPTTFTISGAHTLTISAVVGLGAILSGQTGFDTKEPNNTAASFPYNAYIYGPNNTLGDEEWSTPFGFMFQIDRLNWARTGTKVLFSKGNITNNNGAPWYELSITMKTATVAQFCFSVNGSGGSVAPNSVHQVTCTSNSIDNPNGYNYNLFVTNDGTGAPNSSMKLYVNGSNAGEIYTNPGGSYGFGGVTVAIGGSGTGYAATTTFTSSGGGPNCTVSGTMNAASGVPTSVTLSYTSNYGCTSVPTLTLTSPTGTGATLTAALFGASMSSSTTAPLYLSGYWDGTKGNGSDGNSSESALVIDEFAGFSMTPSQALIQSVFYQTKWYQGLLRPIPATPYVLVFDNDGCGDPDDLYALAVTIAAQKLGYITLAGVVDSDGNGQSMAMYRQMLDQAGLAHIPMSVPSNTSFVNSATCTAANINTYNATTPQAGSMYPTAVAMYRAIFAANPTTPVFIMLGGTFRGVSDLMQSGADSVSSLTGAQMLAQDAANGGAIYIQGLGANVTATGDNSLTDWVAGQYVFAHNGSLPIYAYGGTPQASGPGVLATRNAKDPLYLFAANAGTDYRVAYDSLPTTSFISNFFAGGVTIAIGGSGTGYAASTPFTSTGGGAGCVVTGSLNATGGVPTSITYTTGYQAYEGGGYGCTNAASPPTIVLTSPTGTGVTLTATTTTSGCGTVTITGATNLVTSTSSCANDYFLPMSESADPSGPLLLTWFLNSLIDPPPTGAPRVQ